MRGFGCCPRGTLMRTSMPVEHISTTHDCALGVGGRCDVVHQHLLRASCTMPAGLVCSNCTGSMYCWWGGESGDTTCLPACLAGLCAAVGCVWKVAGRWHALRGARCLDALRQRFPTADAEMHVWMHAT